LINHHKQAFVAAQMDTCPHLFPFTVCERRQQNTARQSFVGERDCEGPTSHIKRYQHALVTQLTTEKQKIAAGREGFVRALCESNVFSPEMDQPTI
jgi:hypothetical protein